MESAFPVTVYTDHSALLSVLQGEGTHQGRINSWMLQMSEYNVEYHHIKGTQNGLADGLSRMKPEYMSPPRLETSDWEDVAAVEFEDDGWTDWLQDAWYGDVTYYKLTGTTIDETTKNSKHTRFIKRVAARYVLMVQEETERRTLLYRESTGELAKCVKENEVEKIMERYHDCHGHFAVDMTLRMMRGRYYWPSRSKDVARYVKSYDACQRFGPLRPSRRELKTLLNLQPMDMMGIDFVGPINPPTSHGKHYILVVVDYFSRYLFARATHSADGNVVVGFLRDITKIMGWLTAIYCDNTSYFMKGVLPTELDRRKVLLFPAPITHPSSVGLAERYVQLLMSTIRTMLEGGVHKEPGRHKGFEKMTLNQWDKYLANAIFMINNRIVKTHGFSPAQLLFGFTPRGCPKDLTPREELVAYSGLLKDKMMEWAAERQIET